MPFDGTQGKPEDKRSTRAEREERVLQFWKENKIFEKTLEKDSPKGEFVFYEGPPTANGKPGIHHLESRAFKDAIPRYKTMRGFRVPRKAGWDTHGLPVEIETEKKLGLKSKKEIEKYGIDKFNAECKRSVLAYIDEWSKFTERIGYWANLDNAYFTYNNSYIESVWNVISHVEKRKLLYKDYKVVPWCPRCGTGLSSHELAQGYQDVKDLSLYVKFKIVGFPDAYFLAWTTTPWTLPGNLALAVGPNITYVEAKVGKEIFVLAKDRLSLLTESYEIIAEHKGVDMVGMAYEPLYPFLKDLPAQAGKSDKSFKVYTADFVTTGDGTGIVHTAVMYGQEDFVLGTKIGLPKHHLVSPDGTFVKGTDWLEGRSVIDENTAVDILKDLQNRGLLFEKENYTHSYPFCWRCKTRLIYYARDSWYIRMSELREELIKENEKINWEPEHIKSGRFGEWLREVKDWALSRERYWGTPLPVWEPASPAGRSEDKERIVVDSLETLKKYTKKSGNKYFAMRHGEAESNTARVLNGKPVGDKHLTEEGRKKVVQTTQSLKNINITKIMCSELLRTQETAELVKNTLKLDIEIIKDNRLNETGFGEYEGRTIEEYQALCPREARFDLAPPGGETLRDMKRRVGGFLYDIETKYKGETILIVSHGDPIWMMHGAAHGRGKEELLQGDRVFYPSTAEMKEIHFTPIPHNEDYELDLHKPYIDEVVLEKDGKEYKRTKEVMDVWLDSGSMPFAQDKDNFAYPADYISEAIDQTRGWFYTLHAVGVLMNKGRSYKNVICLGHILDKDGKKMSKSVGNIVEPWAEIEKHGVDALRLWMYSINQPGEPKNFDEKTVEEVNKRIFNLLDNIYAFYDLYRDKSIENSFEPNSPHVLDRWILARLFQLTKEMTGNIDKYKLLEPVRDLRDFIDDLSTWFLRRSRERLKSGDQNAKQTLYFVLKSLSKLLAPFAPFAAEELYQRLRIEGDLESVHLEGWPKEKSPFSINPFLTLKHSNSEIFLKMKEVRRIVTLALEARSKANIKTRQPLAKLEIKKLELDDEYLDLIRDEVNIKQIVQNKNLTEEIYLDVRITPELEEEGKVRDIIRSIQEMRKEKGLLPGEDMKFQVPENEKDFYTKHSVAIKEATSTIFINE